MKELSTAEAIRYNRQIVIPGFDLNKQEMLMSKSALIIGAGGLGCSAAQFLCASGVGNMTLMDNDTVALSNLQRQILHFETNVGQLKVASAAETLHNINSAVSINAIAQQADEQTLGIQVPAHDIVLDCSDNLSTRKLVNELAYRFNKPLVSGAAIRMEGQIFCTDPRAKTACYACVSRFFGELNLSCVESGVMSPVVGIIGASQALEAIKILTEFGQPAINRLQMYDAMTSTWQTFSVNKHAQCKVCS
ncbi:molybdopterin-synthase adenylyltransferase MoeB [Glaciecola siphonariae]|uniref:Molybdopterin-synthase adenylyltransferase MoeB n=1 Tax=Glaciecola siphonariae TaxID=521012 RepID=A0ABV9LWL3_9ALTE